MSFNTETARWRALTIRDSSANGQFVYSVKSTGIYCRPTCPARLARRANVGFYKVPADAEKAGFRPCKRCKPDEDIEDAQEATVKKACAIIENAIQEQKKGFKLEELAKSVGLTPRYFHKIFKDKTGLTPKEYAKSKQQEQATGASGRPETQRQAEGSPTLDVDDFDFSDLVDLSPDAATPPDDPICGEPTDEMISTILGPQMSNSLLAAGLDLDTMHKPAHDLNNPHARFMMAGTNFDMPPALDLASLDADALLGVDAWMDPALWPFQDGTVNVFMDTQRF